MYICSPSSNSNPRRCSLTETLFVLVQDGPSNSTSNASPIKIPLFTMESDLHLIGQVDLKYGCTVCFIRISFEGGIMNIRFAEPAAKSKLCEHWNSRLQAYDMLIIDTNN